LRAVAGRQWLVLLLVAILFTTIGLFLSTSQGAQAAASWAAAGVLAGLSVAAARELSRNTITSLRSLGKHRGYAVLGAAPDLQPEALRALPPDRRSPLGSLAFQPASPFATAFRDLQSAITDDSLVAFIAAYPNEGATTTALCVAVSAAQQGRNVVLVDCDLRRRSLTRTLGADPESGLLEVAQHPEHWREVVDQELETGIDFIPAARLAGPWRALSDSAGFAQVLANLKAEYDLVVLDCPPVLVSAEGAAIAQLAEKIIVVATWDATPLSALRRAMKALAARGSANTGVYINRVPPGYRFGRLRPT
jgi:Mrp family chromosome partitioning ATPase